MSKRHQSPARNCAALPNRTPFQPPGILASTVLIAVAVLIAYCNSFSVPFLLDDKDSIVENPTIHHLWPIQRLFSPPATATTVSGRPVINISLALNYALGGVAPAGYHAFNLTIHILAALTLLGVVRRTLLQPVLRESFKSTAGSLALAVALLWAVHPLQTESVTYIAQRAESLMGLFYLLTLYCFIRAVPPVISNFKFQISNLWFVLSIAACVLGMGTKEVMVSAPLIVWLYDRTFVAGTFGAALRRRPWFYGGLGASWVVLLCEFGGQNSISNESIGTPAYLLTQACAIVHYLRLCFWPRPLVFDYGALLVTDPAQVAAPVLIVVPLVIGTIVCLWRRPAVGFAGACFFAILAPTSSVLPLGGQTVAEHRMYLPLAAVIALAVLTVHRVFGRRGIALLLAPAMALICLTVQRNGVYGDEVGLWRDTVARREDNARAHNNLGAALRAHGRREEAIIEFRRSLELSPNYEMAGYNLGALLLESGQVDEAIRQFQLTMQAHPNSARIYNDLGAALSQKGQLSEAIACFRKSLELDPELAAAHFNCGNGLVQQGNVNEAIAQWLKALEIQPDYAEVHCNLGTVLVKLGRLPEAKRHFEAAVKINPGLTPALNRLALMLAACPDPAIRNGVKAVELANEAERLSGGRDPSITGTLAAAYAEAGRFSEAITTARRALESASTRSDSALVNSLQRQLALYEAGIPFRDASQMPPPLGPETR